MIIFFILCAKFTLIRKRTNDDKEEDKTIFTKKLKSERYESANCVKGDDDKTSFGIQNDCNEEEDKPLFLNKSTVKCENNENIKSENEIKNETFVQSEFSQSNMYLNILIPLEIDSALTKKSLNFIKRIITDDYTAEFNDKETVDDSLSDIETLFHKSCNVIEGIISKLKEDESAIFYLSENFKEKIDENSGRVLFPCFGEKNILEIIHGVEDKYLFNILFLNDLICKNNNPKTFLEQNDSIKFINDLKCLFKNCYFEHCVNNSVSKKFRLFLVDKMTETKTYKNMLRSFNTFVGENFVFYSFIFENTSKYINFIFEVYNVFNTFTNKIEFLTHSVVYYLTHPQNNTFRYLFPEIDCIISLIKKETLDQLNLQRIYIICTIIAYNCEFLKSNIKTEILENYTEDDPNIKSQTLNCFILNTRILFQLFLVRSGAPEKYIRHSLLLCFFSFIRCKNPKVFDCFYFDDIILLTFKNAFKISKPMILRKESFMSTDVSSSCKKIEYYKIQEIPKNIENNDDEFFKLFYLNLICKRIEKINPKYIAKIFFVSSDGKLMFDLNEFFVEIESNWKSNIFELLDLHQEKVRSFYKIDFYK